MSTSSETVVGVGNSLEEGKEKNKGTDKKITAHHGRRPFMKECIQVNQLGEDGQHQVAPMKLWISWGLDLFMFLFVCIPVVVYVLDDRGRKKLQSTLLAVSLGGLLLTA